MGLVCIINLIIFSKVFNINSFMSQKKENNNIK